MATWIILYSLIFLSVLSPVNAFAAPGSDSIATHDMWVEQGAQVALAKIQLEAFRTKLDRYGVGQKMGFGTQLGSAALARDRSLVRDYGFSLRNLAFNTFNFGRFLFTNEEGRLLKEWLAQTTSVSHSLAVLKVVYDIMADRSASLQNAFAIIDSDPKYIPIRVWADSLAESAWAQNVMTDGTLPLRPLLPSDFGLDFKTDFINEDWKTLLADQASIVNVYVFWRGAAAVTAFGQSPLGLEISRALRVNSLIDAVKTLPPSLQGPTLWIIYETADGCTVRYFQVAYVGMKQFGRSKIVRITRQIKRL